MISVSVDLGPRSYAIEIHHQAPPAQFAEFARTQLAATGSRRPISGAVVITDRNVAGLAEPYAQALGADDYAVSAASMARILDGVVAAPRTAVER